MPPRCRSEDAVCCCCAELLVVIYRRERMPLVQVPWSMLQYLVQVYELSSAGTWPPLARARGRPATLPGLGGPSTTDRRRTRSSCGAMHTDARVPRPSLRSADTVQGVACSSRQPTLVARCRSRSPVEWTMHACSPAVRPRVLRGACPRAAVPSTCTTVPGTAVHLPGTGIEVLV